MPSDRLSTIPIVAVGEVPIKIAVLVSGSGSNLQAILDAAASDPGFPAQVVVVISDRPGVKALDRAEAVGVPGRVVAWGDFCGREEFTAAVCDEAKAHGAEALILAGFMRILSPEGMKRFPNRIVNVHPALLPAFPGTGAVAQAIAHGVKVSGLTVHFVDEQVDHGPIIAQRIVPVLPDDTEDTLHARIQAEEHDLYPQVVEALANGRLRVLGRTVTWEAAP
ncbi:MAG: phosphoribosylglycinamide formyltransferase [Acidimicrobiia bacterium]